MGCQQCEVSVGVDVGVRTKLASVFPPAQRKIWYEARSASLGVLPESFHSISRLSPVMVSPGAGEVTETSARVEERRLDKASRKMFRKIMAGVCRLESREQR